MDSKLLLIKAATVLYRESLIPDKTENSADLVRTVLESVKVPEVIVGLNVDREVISGLKKTVLEMCESPLDQDYIKEDLLQTIKANCKTDDSLYEQFAQSVNTEMSDGSLKRSIINLRKTLHNHFREQELEKILNKAAWEFRHDRDKIKSVTTWVSELGMKLEPFEVSGNKKDPAIINSVSIADAEAVKNVFNSINERQKGTQVLKTGWQAVNEMLQGGFLPGEEWVIGALEHNWKTGFSLSLFKHFALYNEPWTTKPNKKPMLLRISFEDDINKNFQFLYKSLKENETGTVYKDEFTEGPDGEQIPVISPEEKTTYVQKALSVNGWHVQILEVNPSLWTYKDICNKVIEYEAEGFEVICCVVDYLVKIPTTGCDQGPAGVDIRNLYERMRNFFASRGTIFITPHQFSTEAKMLQREGTQDFVKRMVGGAYYAGSKQIVQVIDGELFIHIEKFNKESYLTVQLGKLRRIEQTADEHKYCALKFLKKGVILDDLGKANSAYRKLGGDPIGSGGEEIPYWDFNEKPVENVPGI